MTFSYKKILRIIWESFLKTFNLKIWKWLFAGTFSGALNFIKFGKDFIGIKLLDSAYLAIIGIIVLFCIRFFFIFLKSILNYYHEVYINSAYGEAIILLKDSFAHTHAYRKTPGHKDEAFMKTMLTFCNNLKVIYDEITRSDCAISIKIPLKSKIVDEKAVLKTLTRDIKHTDRETSLYMETSHTVIGNTAFSSTLNKVLRGSSQKHYINNDVSNSKDYENTSKTCYTNGLPYKSELVYPIIPQIAENDQKYDCYGFICIESTSTMAFSPPYHTAIIEGVADGIYDLITIRIG